MAEGAESPETEKVDGVAMDFLANGSTTSLSPPRMPRKLRMRLSKSKTSPSTVEDIEAKLRDADLRRQKFYENLSNKAHQKPRSPSQSSLCEEDLGQPLEAKPQAAEEKGCQKQFVNLRRTTLYLAKAYDALNINEKCVKSMPFEQFALLIKSTTISLSLKALLDRIESRYKTSRAAKEKPAKSSSSCWDDIDHLLKRVASLKKKATARKLTQGREGKKPASTVEASKSSANLSRYEANIVLYAYRIFCHPNAVLSGGGEREIALTTSAEKIVRELELLIKMILNGPIQSSDKEADDPSLARRFTLRSQIAAFDAAWCSYLNSYVVWKFKGARILENDLVRAACQLELSMIQTCKLTPEDDSGALTHGTKAIQKQVLTDQKLLREKVHHLSGDAGIVRMEEALSDTRKKYFQARNDGSSIGSPITHISSPDLPSSSDQPPSLASSDKINDETPSQVICSLFKNQFEGGDSATPRSSVWSQFNISGEKFTTRNEWIANRAVHQQHHRMALLPDSFYVNEEDKNSTKAKNRETMEKALWDDITESLRQEEPNYVQAVELMREVRDEICELAPHSQKQKIVDDIDLDILCQVLNLGKLDMDYLEVFLDLAFTLLNLSVPSNEELKAARQKLQKQLAEVCEIKDESSNCSHVTALIKGLHYVLEQIQVMKQEISKSPLTLLKGPAGLDYLKRAFTNRFGPPSDALTALPLTMRWVSSVCDIKDQEWDEHTNALLELTRRLKSSSQSLLPSSTLRTGGSIPVKMSGSQLTLFAANPTGSVKLGNIYFECKGEDVDLMVRLSLLKLASGVSRLTQEALPETLMLNLPMLRSVQSQLQKIIVISTSVLVLRQTLLSEQMVANPADMEIMMSSCIKQLSVLHDDSKEAGIEEIVKDVGIEEIVEVLGKFVGNESPDNTKLQSMKSFMARMLIKSMQAGDAVFVRVSRAVYLAARGIVLGGGGAHGRELAEAALRQVGAAVLVEKVVAAAILVVVAATVSVAVHRPWYVHLIENM